MSSRNLRSTGSKANKHDNSASNTIVQKRQLRNRTLTFNEGAVKSRKRSHEELDESVEHNAEVASKKAKTSTEAITGPEATTSAQPNEQHYTKQKGNKTAATSCKRKQHSCKHCNSRYRYQSGLDKHMRTKHNSTQRSPTVDNRETAPTAATEATEHIQSSPPRVEASPSNNRKRSRDSADLDKDEEDQAKALVVTKKMRTEEPETIQLESLQDNTARENREWRNITALTVPPSGGRGNCALRVATRDPESGEVEHGRLMVWPFFNTVDFWVDGEDRRSVSHLIDPLSANPRPQALWKAVEGDAQIFASIRLREPGDTFTGVDAGEHGVRYDFVLDMQRPDPRYLRLQDASDGAYNAVNFARMVGVLQSLVRKPPPERG